MRRVLPAFAVLLFFTGALHSAPVADKSGLKAKYEGQTFVLQHNLHIDDGEAEWQNFISGDFVDLGSKVTVKQIDGSKAILVFDDPARTIKLDLAGANPSAAFVLDRMLGAAAPSLKGLGKTDLQGIKYASIMEGMTRKAVFLSVGYPPYAYTPPFRKDSAVNHDPEADELTYMKGTYDFIKIGFSKGKIVEIED